MGGWLVAIILLLLCLLVIGSILIVCRIIGLRQLSAWFAPSEEKTNLTAGTTSNAETRIGILRGDPPAREEVNSPVSDTVSETESYTGHLPRATSFESVASDSSVLDVDFPSKIGQLEFGIEYDRESRELIVSVIQAKDLELDQVTKSLDSFVKLWLTPPNERPMQTRIYKDSINPIWKERFKFDLEYQEIERKSLQLQVFSSDKYARHKLLGETELRLGDLDFRVPLRIWMNLRDMDEKPTEVGDVMLSLSYLPTAERLTVVIVKARKLKWAYSKANGDCFVKVYLLQNGKKISKKKTTLKKDEKTPIFNEAMIFSIPAAHLENVQLRISVVEQLGENILPIGHVLIGSQVSGTELTHWNQMMTSLRKPVAMWHQLRK